MTKILATVALAAIAAAGPVIASDIDTVRAFYADVLTNPAGTTPERYYELFSPDVVSIPTPPGGEGAQGMLNTLAFLGRAVPDLTWEATEIIETKDNRFVVRGVASGTPQGPFLFVDPASGKRFEIMSIDIITVKDGLITHIYHLEDWIGAINQLTPD